MYSSPTFNALRESAEAGDFYDFGTTSQSNADGQICMTSSPNQEFSLVEQRDELTLVKGDSAENFSGLGQTEKGCTVTSDQKVRRELSFKDHSDLFCMG